VVYFTVSFVSFTVFPEAINVNIIAMKFLLKVYDRGLYELYLIPKCYLRWFNCDKNLLEAHHRRLYELYCIPEAITECCFAIRTF
jgi:hypothetical protein